MKMLDASAHRHHWLEALKAEKAFYLEQPAVFSSAAAAQDAANQSRMLRKWGVMWLPWEYTGWLEEGRSFHDAAYIGDWSGIEKIRIKGPDALAFLQQTGTNDLAKFAVGRMKHYVQVDHRGKIGAQGVLYRLDADDFMFTGATSTRVHYLLQGGQWDAESVVETPDVFTFSVQGPRSRDIIEQAFGIDIESIRFNQFQTFPFASISLRVLRTGVSGALGYEVHGPSTHGNAVWAKIVEVGAAAGLRQLGVRAQMISHVEAGIASNGLDFYTVPTELEGVPQALRSGAGSSARIGSFPITDPSELYRSPAELGWFTQVSLDTHDFVGRDALLSERQAGGPARRLVGLMWDSDDVAAVFRTLFEEEVVLPMEMPRYVGMEINAVLDGGGKLAGCATSRTYSPFLHRMISLAHIDTVLAQSGAQVRIVWGGVQGAQREIRAQVIELPFKKDLRRSDV